MGAPTQKGDSLVIGLGSYLYTAHIVEGAKFGPTADVDEYRNEDDEVINKTIANPGDKLSLDVIVKTGGGADQLEIGDALTINSIAWMVVNVDADRSRKAEKVRIDLVKEDSMTYS